MSITGTGVSAAGGLRTVSVTIRSQPHDRDLVLFAPIYDKINNRIDARRIISKSSSVSSGVYQVILGDTFARIAVDSAYTLTVVSGSATRVSATDVNITGGCVLSVEPVAGYQSDLAKFLTHGTTELKAEDWVGDTSTWAYQCYRQTRLVTVTFPFGYTGIQSYTFSNCSGLKAVNFPATIQNIYTKAFEYCTALETVTLPAGMRLLLDNAFVGCSSLKSVTIEATTPPTLGTGVFTGTHADLVIYVPAESVEAYKTATNWSTYADKIQAIPNS